MDLKDIHPDMMRSHIGSEFRVMGLPGGPVSLTLDEVVEREITPRTETFSIFFHGPAEPFLAQDTRTLEHEGLGKLVLFLVPVGRDSRGYQYEAAFNHLL